MFHLRRAECVNTQRLPPFLRFTLAPRLSFCLSVYPFHSSSSSFLPPCSPFPQLLLFPPSCLFILSPAPPLPPFLPFHPFQLLIFLPSSPSILSVAPPPSSLFIIFQAFLPPSLFILSYHPSFYSSFRCRCNSHVPGIALRGKHLSAFPMNTCITEA